MALNTVSVYPNHGLGPINLGASLHEVFSLIHNDKATYPQIDLNYDRTNPLTIPVVVSLPQNGLRLRFDGPDQQLRLVEVLDFRKIRLTYKGSELVKNPQTESGPAFKRIYTLFGATYAGEYHLPMNGDRHGRYVLSWAGVAFTFPVQHAAWSPQKDHVSLLGSNAADAATVMAIFEGGQWPDIRNNLFTRKPSAPRLSAIASRPKDNLPAEIESATISSTTGRIKLLRRAPAAPFTLILNQTTPQDLITELGPPDATQQREVDLTAPTEQPQHNRAGSMSNGLTTRTHTDPRGSQPSSYSSTGTDTFDADFDSGDADEDPADRPARQTFWCYFRHGLDILIAPAGEADTATTSDGATPLAASPHLVATKVVLHGNVPGSYAFNRHRRLCWELSFPDTEYLSAPLDSETNFAALKPALLHLFHGSARHDLGKGKVVNRTWGGGGEAGGMSESGFFLPDAEEELIEGSAGEAWLGNTRVFAFDGLGVGGLGFEVLDSGCIVGVTVF